ncbi:hypothetical protein [Shimia sp.]|uniref:hypothetical protein n=1 Tax=Shimia sp. TaxID=1954381 RepID=UPI003B8C2C9C
MTASVFDSPMFTKLFPVGEAGRLFTHSTEIRAALLVLGTLAKVQGTRGDIPEDSAFFIHRSAIEVQVDPAGLADGVAQDGIYVPALVAAFAKAMEAPMHSKFLMQATSPQDIADTALMLRLRQLLSQAETDLTALQGRMVVEPQLAALQTVKGTALHVAFVDDVATGEVIAEALKLGTPASAPASVLAISSCLATVAEAVVVDTPIAQALCHSVLASNELLHQRDGEADARMTEQLCLPHIALGTLSLLQMAIQG